MGVKRIMPRPKIPHLEVIGITGISEITGGENLGSLIADAAQNQETPLRDGDVLVVTQKIVSKAEHRLLDLNDVEPSPLAVNFAQETQKDPRLVELVLRESRSVVRMDSERGIIISETMHGFVCANAGIDNSNVPGDDIVCLLPEDSDRSARAIRDEIKRITHADVAIVISDTFGRAWRDGHANIAIGVAGMNPVKDYRGTLDVNGVVLKVTTIAAADELAAAAELVTAKAIQVPVALIRGYGYEHMEDATIAPLIRERSKDMFR